MNVKGEFHEKHIALTLIHYMLNISYQLVNSTVRMVHSFPVV